MNLQSPVTIAALQAAFDSSVAKAEADFRWYADRIRRYRILSFVIRGLTLLAIILGVTLPLTSKDRINFYWFDGPAEAGYACLIVAVLVLGVDHVFMLSGTWVRFINALTKIRTLILRAEYDWARMKSGLANDAVAHEQKDKACELFERLVLDSRKVVEDETATWGSELGQALQRLDGLVKEQRIALDTVHKEEQKAREAAEKSAKIATTGGLAVQIDQPDTLQGLLTIRLDDEAVERSVPVQKVVFPRVPEGQHAIVLTGTDTTGNQVRVEDLVIVEANKIANVVLELPSRNAPRSSS